MSDYGTADGISESRRIPPLKAPEIPISARSETLTVIEPDQAGGDHWRAREER